MGTFRDFFMVGHRGASWGEVGCGIGGWGCTGHVLILHEGKSMISYIWNEVKAIASIMRFLKRSRERESRLVRYEEAIQDLQKDVKALRERLDRLKDL